MKEPGCLFFNLTNETHRLGHTLRSCLENRDELQSLVTSEFTYVKVRGLCNPERYIDDDCEPAIVEESLHWIVDELSHTNETIPAPARMTRRECMYMLLVTYFFEITMRQWECAPLTMLRSSDLLLARVTLNLASRGIWVLQNRSTRHSSSLETSSLRSNFKFLHNSARNLAITLSIRTRISTITR